MVTDLSIQFTSSTISQFQPKLHQVEFLGFVYIQSVIIGDELNVPWIIVNTTIPYYPDDELMREWFEIYLDNYQGIDKDTTTGDFRC